MVDLLGDSCLGIVGFASGSHIGASFHNAALSLSIHEQFIELMPLDGISRLVDRVGLRLPFAKSIWSMRTGPDILSALKLRPPGSIVLFAGIANVSPTIYKRLSESGIYLVGFLSDDPWNKSMIPLFDLEILKYFQILFTPRQSNIVDLISITAGRVEYLPFGYDPSLVNLRSSLTCEAIDALFVGGGDLDRARLLAPLCRTDLNVKLVGGYWRKFTRNASQVLGLKNPGEVNSLSLAAKVNVCAVRRANRDGHVMRSFELGALGCTILAERTDEHLQIFGPDRECVWYFDGPEDLKNKALLLCSDETERLRLAGRVRIRIVEDGKNRYEDRLAEILRVVRDEQARA